MAQGLNGKTNSLIYEAITPLGPCAFVPFIISSFF
jgi:hypothetical protein